jgi:tRNA_anti-like
MMIQDACTISAKRPATLVAMSLLAAAACKAAPPAAEVAPPTSDSQATASNTPAAKLDELMSVSRLLASYKENAHQADTLLKGKRVRVWGAIDDVTHDASGALTITLGASPAGDAPRARCSFADRRASGGADLRRGADVTVDCTCAGLDTDVVLKDCTAPHCAIPLCEQLRAQGVASDCKQATKDWSDSATFRMPSVVTRTGVGGGYVECEPNDKVYYLMVNDLNSHQGANERVFASPKARVVVSLASDDPIPPDILAKTRTFVEAL